MVKQKKTMKMKKIYIVSLITVLLVTTLAISAVGCSNQEDTDYVVGVVQCAPHPALDAAYEGFKTELTRQVEEIGKTISFDYTNSLGDFSADGTNAQNLVAKNVDLIYTLGTPSSRAAKSATNDTKIPVIFNAVTAPSDKETNLVKDEAKPEGNVTGISDRAPIKQQLDLLKELTPGDTMKVGVLYNKDEPNSAVQANQVKAYCDEKGWGFFKMELQGNIDTLNNAFNALKAQDITGLYLPTDNLLANNIESVRNANHEITKVPIVCAEVNMSNVAGVGTYGLSYYELGKMAAKQAFEILVEGKSVADIPVKTQEENFDFVLNKDNAEAINLTIPQSLLDKYEAQNK